MPSKRTKRTFFYFLTKRLQTTFMSFTAPPAHSFIIGPAVINTHPLAFPHPHRPRLVVYHSTCRPLSSSPPREQLCNRSCSNKHTPLLLPLTLSKGAPRSQPDRMCSLLAARVATWTAARQSVFFPGGSRRDVDRSRCLGGREIV